MYWLFQLFIPYNVKWGDDVWTINWKQSVKELLWPNLKYFSNIWIRPEKNYKNSEQWSLNADMNLESPEYKAEILFSLLWINWIKELHK